MRATQYTDPADSYGDDDIVVVLESDQQSHNTDEERKETQNTAPTPTTRLSRLGSSIAAGVKTLVEQARSLWPTTGLHLPCCGGREDSEPQPTGPFVIIRSWDSASITPPNS